MSIIDSLISIVVPHECIGCTKEGSLLCSGCLRQQTRAMDICYRCYKRSPDGRICVECQPSPLSSTRSMFEYSGLTKDLLWGLKSGGMQASVRPMALTLAQLAPEHAVIVPIPTATGRVRQRGYDQAVLLARELSKQTGLPCLRLLRRTGQAHQVGASRAARKKQIQHAYWSKPAKGLHVLLIDDVMTTGATLETAATALIKAGATRVDALTFARA